METLTTIIEKVFNDELNLEKNDKECFKKVLTKFCSSGAKEDAFSVYFAFCEVFKILGSGYDTTNKLLEFLADHECHSGELLNKHRDHYSHSVYVFALGLAIYFNDREFANIFRGFYSNDRVGNNEFLFLWGMTALFHDIGYPFQLAHEQVKVYVDEMWGENLQTNPFVSYENMDWLLTLTDKAKSEINKGRNIQTISQLLAHNINERLGYPIDVLENELNNRYLNKAKFMDHGFFSAILLARRLMDSDIELSESIVDVLSAIALHNNFNRYDLKAILGKPTSIAPEKHPLAYLLILCDELQNWDRQAFGYVSKKDPLAWGVELDVSEKLIHVQYVFEDMEIKTPCLVKKDGSYEINEESRVNINILKLMAELDRSGNAVKTNKFTDEINSLIVAHTNIFTDFICRSKNKKIQHYISSDKFINLCDFARAIHESYRSLQQVSSGVDVGPFEELSLEFKLSNIEQAKSYSKKLELINCFYSDKELEYPIVNGFVEKGIIKDGKKNRDELGFLAREEHVRWVKEKLAMGWKYGKEYVSIDENGIAHEDIKKRNLLKIHKDLVPYDCLPDVEKEKDRLMIRNMIPFLYKYGHGVRIYSYREGRKPVINIAGCGHRTINAAVGEIKEQIKAILSNYMQDYRVVVRTNFAFGADQLIAKCANELGITIKATLPLPYDEYIEKIKEDSVMYNYRFTKEDEIEMRHLLAQAVSCKVVRDEKYIYLEASRYIVNKCDKMIALWDGVETKLVDQNGKPINQGGTYHNITMAEKSRGLKMYEDIHIIKCER